MRKIILLLVLITSLFSCKKSEKQKATVHVNFQAVVSSNTYQLYDYFNNYDGKELFIELLQFYLSDVYFISDKSKEIQGAEIVLVKINQNGFGSFDVKIPADDYTKIKFGIGVKKELNESDPNEYAEDDHPLSVTQNTYWGMNGMYRFVMIDGKYDLDANDTADGSFSYHTGFEECYREVEFPIDLSLDKKEAADLNFMIDVSKFFSISGNEVDVATESNYHGNLTDLDLAIRISNNFATSISLP